MSDANTQEPTDASAPLDRAEFGPFDESEANPVRPYIDLGGIKILPREGLNLRLEVEEQTKRIVAVGLDYADSTLQVQPFAAPRSSGLWEETREQIRQQVRQQGGRVEEREGPLGPELRRRPDQFRRRSPRHSAWTIQRLTVVWGSTSAHARRRPTPMRCTMRARWCGMDQWVSSKSTRSRRARWPSRRPSPT